MDIRQYYIEKGQGEPLILLHGNGENCDYFAGQMDAFARHFHVYALDTRGHGIVKAHILGFSDGGNTAMIFANKRPDTFNRAILDFLSE